jgi:hypothetical protein
VFVLDRTGFSRSGHADDALASADKTWKAERLDDNGLQALAYVFRAAGRLQSIADMYEQAMARHTKVGVPRNRCV